jgi:hypothetical protein
MILFSQLRLVGLARSSYGLRHDNHPLCRRSNEAARARLLARSFLWQELGDW